MPPCQLTIKRKIAKNNENSNIDNTSISADTTHH